MKEQSLMLRSAVLGLMLACLQTIMAQTLTVTGEVTDEKTNEPLIGVNIWEKGSQNGTVTDFDGNFCIIHGDKDQAVPYDKNVADVLNFSAFGPAYYTQQLEEMKVPFMFLTGVDADHLLSAAPLIGDDVDYSEYVFSFITRMVLGKEKLAQRITESYYDVPYSFEIMLRKIMEQKAKEEQNK